MKMHERTGPSVASTDVGSAAWSVRTISNEPVRMMDEPAFPTAV
jgi:hypothetical protein